MLRLIRGILSKIILLLDSTFAPTPTRREPQEQARIDGLTSPLALYEFRGCPFCVKVRRAVKRLTLKIELRDANLEKRYADELLREGGALQVPCLRIPQKDGTVRWLYESSDIISYLEKLAISI